MRNIEWWRKGATPSPQSVAVATNIHGAFLSLPKFLPMIGQFVVFARQVAGTHIAKMC